MYKNEKGKINNKKLKEKKRNNIILPDLKKRQDSQWERKLLGKDF